MTIAQDIASSQVYKSGELFTSRQMANHLGVKQSSVSFALKQMREDSMVDHVDGRYWRGWTRHWIHDAAC